MVAVVIVGYNSKEFLGECLQSVLDSSYNQLQVIFVDNNSSDGSAQYIKENFSDVLVLKSEKNVGFAGGNNLGIKKALELNSEYLFFLNPDTVIDKNCIKLLVEGTNHKSISQPLILLHQDGNKTNLINTWGNDLNYLGISYCSGYMTEQKKAKKSNIPLASGAAFLAPKEFFETNDGFDEDFFMYHEDVDLSWRAREAGYDIKLSPDAKVWHKYNFSRNKKKFFFIERNRLLFLAKNFQIKTILLILPALIIQELVTLIFSIFGGWLHYKIASFFSFLYLLPKIISKRKTINHKRSDREIKKYLSTKINSPFIQAPGISIYNFWLKLYWDLIFRII